MIQTGYGKMAIEEYTPGKFRSVRGSVGGHATGTTSAPSTRRSPDKPKGEAGLTVAGAGSSPAPSPIDRYDSKLEAARATYLGYLLLAKDIRRVVHHPFTVQLSEHRTYTPDYLIEWLDGRIQVEEVKGSTKQKNARDSITRLHLAAAKLPMFDWRLTRRVRGQWDEKKVPG